jgi:hypothetical protein
MTARVRHILVLYFVATSVVVRTGVVFAQDENTAPQDEVDKTQQQESVDPLPDLDDLLGLPRESSNDDTDQEELDRALTNQQVKDQFKQAVSQMQDVATALRDMLDPGLQTQRTQEEILKKLDLLIEQAQQNSQSGSSQASSQQQQQQQQQSPQQQQTGASQQSNGTNQGQEQAPPGGQSAELTSLLEATQAAWGSLPPRIRDTLLQGSKDRFSTLYESLTESYYRRLAEDSPEQ